MKKWLLLGALCAWPLLSTPAIAQDSSSKALEERIQKLEESLKTFQEHERRERVREREPFPPAGGPPAGGVGPITDIKVERKGEEKVPLGFGSTGSGKLVYAKPFLSAPKATVGGYFDLMYNNLSRQTLDNPSRNTFNQQRMVPFIYADITDHVKFATEIEIERGGPNAPQSGDGAMQIEFAQLDYLINEAVNLRAGILLMPVGKFNLLHDSPLNDLVDRPMVSRIVIPSTWFDSGAGIYGTLYPSSLSKLDYEVYAVNGFSNIAGAPTDLGIRNSRGSVSRDRDDSKAIVGRVAFSPMLGIEVAGSGYHGQFKQATATTAAGYIDMFAVDWTLQRGPFEVIGESAWTRISNNGSGPAGMQGYYVQGNYHFLPDFLKQWAPTRFTDASTFTAVVRWERVDTDTDDRTKILGTGNRRQLERLTLGLNFRPIEDTVFKFDWQFNTQKDAVGLVNGGDFGGSNNPLNGNGFLVQAATYF